MTWDAVEVGQHTAIVVGGGIAGLAAAAALLRAGWRVTVLEQRRGEGEIGAGLAITRNGLAAMEAIEAGQAVQDAGYQVFVAGTRNYHGRWLLDIPDTRNDPDSMNWACGVHRRRLHRTLAAAAARADMITGAQVRAVEVGDAAGGAARVIWCEDGRDRAARADLVVAADGTHSTVRRQLFPACRLAYSGKTCWRSVVHSDCDVDERFTIVWGPTTEFGAVRISNREVYWYGYFEHPADTPIANELEAARQHFAGWPSDVRRVVDTTCPEQLVRHDVYHLVDPLSSYVRGRVLLIGDAAHAMLPTMGQGANTSLEDGVCVGRIVGAAVYAGVDLTEAMARFDQARRPRTQAIAWRSRLTERIGADLRAGWPQVLRDAVLQVMPSAAFAKAGSQVLRWKPPISAAPTSEPRY